MSSGNWGPPEEWRDNEFGHGQERYYGTPGHGQERYYGTPQPQPDPSPASPPTHREPDSGGGGGKGVAIGVAVVAALAIAGGGAYWVSQAGSDESETQTVTTATPTAASTSSTSAGPGASTTTSAYTPITQGWRVGAIEDSPLMFDVPPESETFQNMHGQSAPTWSFEDGRYGYPDPRNPLAGAFVDGPAVFRIKHCEAKPNTSLGFIGFIKSTSGSDPLSAASSVSSQFLETMSLKSDGKSRVKYKEGVAKDVKVNNGKTNAVQIRTSVPWSLDEDFCEKRERDLVVTTVPTSSGSATVVASRLKSAKGGLDEKTFEKILDSIRLKPSS
ncbi:hypothetical protein [Demetria terragena]|uniref:hypothetical protein n=1 Tax=Demetria terragena TaxID=63959 RepID=UPI0012EAAEE9|nr:hypothetical protein [Demetria terragena]